MKSALINCRIIYKHSNPNNRKLDQLNDCSISCKNLIAPVSAISYRQANARTPKPPFYPQQRNVDAGHGFGCGGNFLPENLWRIIRNVKAHAGHGFQQNVAALRQISGGEAA